MKKISSLLPILRAHHFDLPFHAKLGTEFLVFLTALMTLLCLLSVAASLFLANMADKWTSGLENTLTVEIPASAKQNNISSNILSALKDADGIKSARLMDQKEMSHLLSPWLGNAEDEIVGLPLPYLITVELEERDQKTIQNLTRMVVSVAPDVKVDTHEQWLSDLVKLTDMLKIIALIIILSIGLVTALTIGGAVRTRMAIHHAELELLHIMGAGDKYISNQFQRYIFLLAGKGVFAGFIMGVAILGILKIASMTYSEALPGLNITFLQAASLPLTALILVMICMLTARYTALQVLKRMP